MTQDSGRAQELRGLGPQRVDSWFLIHRVSDPSSGLWLLLLLWDPKASCFPRVRWEQVWEGLGGLDCDLCVSWMEEAPTTVGGIA